MPHPTVTKTLPQIWGENVAARRQMLRLSQGQLAELIGVEQQTVSKWENGETTPREARKLEIARALGTSVAALFAYPDGLAAS